MTIASYEHRHRRLPGIEVWGILLLVAAVLVWVFDAYAMTTVL